jgi:DNA-binding response OmpR family regulator
MAASAERLLRVLIVDDNRDAADSLATLCTIWGHEVRSAYNGSAIDMVPVFLPDVIVLDIAMPRINGNKMAQMVRAQEQFKNTLIIAVSGYQDEANRMLSREAGIDHYLIKPVDPSVLQKLLTGKHMMLRLGQ